MNLKREVIATLIGVGLGVIGTGLTVWRDMSVAKIRLEHMEEDLNLIKHFITDENPEVWLKAKETLRKDLAHHLAEGEKR